MNTQEILPILRGERGKNPNIGIEEDDLLANDFFDLSKVEQETFWSELAQAMQILIAGKEGLPFYLAARFIFRMSEIDPPRLPRKKSLFNFLFDMSANDVPPPQFAGTLLTLLVLKLKKDNNAEFWKRQVSASLDSLETTQDDRYAMAAVVYAFLGYNRCAPIPAKDWERLFVTLSHLPRLPRMELLELLVGVEKDIPRDPSILEREISLGWNCAKPSASDVFEKQLISVFRTWLDRNEPHAVIAAWLRQAVRPAVIQTATPKRMVILVAVANHRAAA